MASRIVVIGGGAAGMSAASAARRTAPEREVVVLEATGYAGWGLCGLPYYLAGTVAHAEDLLAYPPAYFRRERGIDLRLHTLAHAIDPVRRVVSFRSPSGTGRLPYGALVVTAGGTPVRPALPGVDSDRVFTLRRLEEAIRLRALLDAGRLSTVLVVGAGYIGLELAEAFSARGCSVIVAELLDRVVPNLDPELSSIVEAGTRQHVDLRLGTMVSRLADTDAGVEVSLGTGETLQVDAVILAVGVRPAASLAADAGAATLANGALLVDERQRTSVPDVFAAGDCVAAHHRVIGRPVYTALAPAANRMGRVAGTVAAGGDATFPGVTGTAVVKVFDLHISRTGLTAAEAAAEGIPAIATDITHRSRAKYYPGSRPVHLRLVHTDDGRVLGAQIVSEDQTAAKRIDVVAAALHAGLGVADLEELDLAYSPPYSPVYDPLTVAAQAASRKLVGALRTGVA